MKVGSVLLPLAFVVVGLTANAQEQTPVQPGPGIQNPVLIRRVEPKYTSEAMKQKIQGEIQLQAVVDADGTVRDIRVIKSLDRTFGLDEKAIEAARQWLFKPGQRDGRAVPVIVTLVMSFSVQQSPSAYSGDDEFLKGTYRIQSGVTAPVVKTRVEAKYTADAMRHKRLTIQFRDGGLAVENREILGEVDR